VVANTPLLSSPQARRGSIAPRQWRALIVKKNTAAMAMREVTMQRLHDREE